MCSRVCPTRCLLCNSESKVLSAGFEQIYSQGGGTPVRLDWWECSECRGWFTEPPPLAAIESHWQTVQYGDAGQESEIAAAKRELCLRILGVIGSYGLRGKLLDVGCSTGALLQLAGEAGWEPSGYDPNPAAIQVARTRGHAAEVAWTVQEGDFPENEFQAVTAVDVFYYSWHPFRDLTEYHRLLRPDGWLAMRISNKRLFLGLIRTLWAKGEARNSRLSRYLQGQFHSISLASLTRILRAIGFAEVRILPNALTAPFWSRSYRWSSRALYAASSAVYFGTLGRLNLSPGVVLLARKTRRNP